MEQHIPASFDEKRPPALFTHTSHDKRLEEHPLASQLPRPSLEPVISEDIRKFGDLLRGPVAPKRFSELLEHDIPQITVHIESFTDATLVCLSWPHTLSDVLGMAFFLKAWQAVLEGRHEDVPNLNSAEIDPLETAGRVPVESYYLSIYMMSMWSIAMFICNLIISWLRFGSEEWRTIYIPGDWLHKIHAQANHEVKQMKVENSPTFVSRNDVITAVLSKIGCQLTWTRKQPVFLYQATDVRQRLSTMSPLRDMATVGNFTTGTLTLMPAGQVRDWSVGQIAAALRQTTQIHNEGDQLDALMAIWRRDCQKGIPISLGCWYMHIVSASNWARGTSFDIDFSAARKSPADTDKPMRPTMTLPYVDFEHSMFGSPSFVFAGPDESGGYWVNGTTSKSRWRTAYQVFAEVGLCPPSL